MIFTVKIQFLSVKGTLCKKQVREADDEPHIAGMFSPNGRGGGSDEKKRRAQPYSYFLQ